MHDVIVIGGGVNGLVAAAVLAKHKLSTLVIEQRPQTGGAAATTEITPGFRAPQLSHALGPIRRDVARALRLDRAGLDFITPDPSLTTIGDGHVISFHPDAILTAGSINAVAPHDAARWREFLLVTQRLARLIADLNRHAPPQFEMAASEIWRLVRLGRRARRLGARDLARLARWIVMPVADLLDEWFEDDLLKAAIAAHAIFGNPAGPRSAGTGAMLLQRLADDPAPAGSGATVRGGPGALAAALERIAVARGAQIRIDARVVRIATTHGAVSGVVLENGDTVQARSVVAAIDPRQTLLDLVDPEDLTPTIRERARNYRTRGVTAKINLALSGLPSFTGLHGDVVPMRGRLLIAPSPDYLERACDAIKYGQMSPDPWLEISIPSVIDPALAPEGCHVMSICAHFAPYKLRDARWADARGRLYQSVLQVLTTHAPNLQALIVHREVLTPEDLERVWGLSGGHIFHGEPALDQSWMARPFPGCAQYRAPIDGLYLASAGTHPGGGLTGGPGFIAATTVLSEIKKRRRDTASSLSEKRLSGAD